MSFQISTSSFSSGASIPTKFTCDGQDVSPQLSWSRAPEATKSFALIADDPDAPAGTWTHWLIWDIPVASNQLAEGVPKTEEVGGLARQGQNDFRKIGYNGPCPPPGKPHRYYFKLFALDSKLNIHTGANRAQLDAAMKGHILAQTEVMGRYGR
ncbi:MAG TPA: YbhB/YbcL family Raf kinase inhibitor-like protein [Terriglobales bacterium]|nr:YbhB/YbcL family Raf kinase inhibitor-like protein [Terriglobales bacterium]